MTKRNNTAAALPSRFVPKFWNEADGRCTIIKDIRRRYESLKQDAKADSIQKDLLC